MGMKINNSSMRKEICWELLILLISVFWIQGTVLFVLATAFIAWNVIKEKRIIFNFHSSSWIFFVILVLGIVMDVYTQQIIKIHTLVRYCLYVISPIIYIYYGVYLNKRKSIETCIKTTFIAGGLSSLFFLMKVFSNFFSGGLSITSLRNAKSYVTILVVLSIFIYLLYGNTNKLYSRRTNRIVLICTLFSTFISFSRTNLLYFLMSGIVFFLSYINSKRTYKVVISVCAISLVAFAFIESNQTISTLMDSYGNKIFSSSSELKTQYAWTEVEINNSWRGYEVHKAQQQFSEADLQQKLFGSGASGVYVGYYSKLVSGAATDGYIPVIHNGYYGVLTYAGLVGLILYIYFYIKNYLFAFKYFRKNREAEAVLLKIIVLETAVSTFVVMGPISMEGAVYSCVLIGVLYNSLLSKNVSFVSIEKV